MSLTSLSVRRPVATVMFFLGVILLGVVSLRNLTVDLLPSLSYPKLTVITEYPGAAPEEVERFITVPLESRLAPVAGVKRVKSISREGLSIITLEFHWGTNMDFALLHVKEKVEEASDVLPEGCSKPRIYEWDPSSRPILIAVVKSSKGQLGRLREAAEYLIKPRLEQLRGVSRVEVRGGGQQEVLVKVDPRKLALYGVSFAEVARAIEDYNQVVLGGTVKKNKLRFVVKVEGEIKRAADIEDIPVKRLSIRPLLVKDVADVMMVEKLRQGDVRLNAAAAVALLVFKEAHANTVEATAAVKKAFSQLEKEFADLRFEIISEEAGLILSSINSLKLSLYIGAVLAFLVLLLFLQNFRDPALVAAVMPIAVISTFVLMYFAGVNINIMSLGGLALGVGMFVDNSIVVLESLFRHRQLKDPVRAAVDGTSEVAGAITASTLTTIVIFLPVIYVYGITGRLFRDQALTVSFSLLASLVVALTLLPSLFAALSSPGQPVQEEAKEKKKGAAAFIHSILSFPFMVAASLADIVLKGLRLVLGFVLKLFSLFLKAIFNPIFKGFNRAYRAFSDAYHSFLKLCLERKLLPFSIAALMLAATVALYFGLKKELLPLPSSPVFEIKASTPSSLGFEETDEIAKGIEARLLSLDGIESVFCQTGAASALTGLSPSLSVNNIHMIVRCRDAQLREPLMEKARAVLASYPGLAGAVMPERTALSEYLRFGAEEFQLQVFYERIQDGRKVVGQLLRELSKVKGLVDLRTNAVEGKPVIALDFKEEFLRGTGVSRAELARLVMNSLRGETVTVLRQFQRSYDIVLATPLRQRRDFASLLQLPVKLGKTSYRLGDIVIVKELPSVKEITREGQERYFLVSASLAGRKLADVAADVEKILSRLSLPAGVRVRMAGEEEERRKAFASVREALILAALLVYMVMASQFENLLHPFIIMFTLPMGFFGAFLALFLTGSTLNVIAGIGLLVMTGIVVNDAIVKIDYTNKLRAKGMGLREAILEASRVRLRPILMTTFTTVAGLLPMALMSQPGSELQRPLALVVIGGLLLATFLTLILIPVIYEVVEGRRR